MFYAIHKQSTDAFKYWPKELVGRPMEVKVLEDNKHHWRFQFKAETFIVCKYPLKERFKSIPPFKTLKETLAYLQADIPTFDKEGHRL